MKLYTHLGEVLLAFRPLLTFLADAVLHTNILQSESFYVSLTMH